MRALIALILAVALFGGCYLVKVDFSEEMIENIVNRVLERLSTNVIRDVAKELIPPIAEKLIAEKLSELDVDE